MKLAMLLISSILLLLVTTNVEAHPGHKPRKLVAAADVPMPPPAPPSPSTPMPPPAPPSPDAAPMPPPAPPSPMEKGEGKRARAWVWASTFENTGS